MYSIRTATIKDLDQVTAIEAICFPPEQAASKVSFEARLKAFADHFFLLEREGECVGFINGAVIDARYIIDEMYADTGFHTESGGYQSVFGLDVLPEYRGKGLAHRLMEHMASHAKAQGRKGVTLTCREEKIGFYEGMGFVCEGKSDSCHGDVVWYDMILSFED